MATVTFDGLWPNVRPADSSNALKAGKSLFERIVENQERRASYRLAMMYDAKTLRSMGMDEDAIKRMVGTKF